MLIGNGWDLHKHSSSSPLYLAGLEFQEEGFEAYSDGDIVLHALCDALLGSARPAARHRGPRAGRPPA